MPKICLGKRATSLYDGRDLDQWDMGLDIIDELGIDGRDIARVMGEVLAVLNWEVKTDAGRVEFILAGKARSGLRNVQPKRGVLPLPSLAQDTRAWVPELTIDIFGKKAYIWLMDFDKCMLLRSIEGDDMINALADRIMENPCFPMPTEPGVWEAFRGRYLEASMMLNQAQRGNKIIDTIELRHQNKLMK